MQFLPGSLWFVHDLKFLCRTWRSTIWMSLPADFKNSDCAEESVGMSLKESYLSQLQACFRELCQLWLAHQICVSLQLKTRSRTLLYPGKVSDAQCFRQLSCDLDFRVWQASLRYGSKGHPCRASLAFMTSHGSSECEYDLAPCNKTIRVWMCQNSLLNNICQLEHISVQHKIANMVCAGRNKPITALNWVAVNSSCQLELIVKHIQYTYIFRMSNLDTESPKEGINRNASLLCICNWSWRLGRTVLAVVQMKKSLLIRPD